jgi:hypothetical protein
MQQPPEICGIEILELVSYSNVYGVLVRHEWATQFTTRRSPLEYLSDSSTALAIGFNSGIPARMKE